MIPLTRPLVAVDLETTGLGPTARIVQIGLIRYNVDGTQVPYWTLVNPGIKISAGAKAKHGIWDEHVLMKPRWEDIAPKLLRAFEGADVAGYNAKFDLDVLGREFARVGLDVSQLPKLPVLDGLRLWQVLEPRTLTDFAQRWLGRPHAGAHDAMADITVTMAGIEVLLGQVALSGKTIEELIALQWPKDPDAIDAAGKIKWDGGEAVLTFGKWNHTPLSKVERSYFSYLLKQDFAEDAKAIFRDALNGVFPKRADDAAV